MSLSFLAMFIVVALGILLLGGIVAIARRKWRPLGIVLLGIPLGLAGRGARLSPHLAHGDHAFPA